MEIMLRVSARQKSSIKKKLTGLGKSLEDYDMLIIGFASEY